MPPGWTRRWRPRGYDEWVVVEEGVHGREIEVGVLGNAEPRASVPGEIVSSHEFYDYEDKYIDGTCELVVPADLDAEATERVRALALDAYRALRCDGMARVDFFYEEGRRGFLVNEVNTIPGFTPGSMYPGCGRQRRHLPRADRRARLAVERHDHRSRFSTKR